MKTWEEIRALRTDMSQYVMHCTKPRCDQSGQVLVPAEAVLRELLGDGFLRATFAVTKSTLSWRSRPTVRGPYPAVCFTEQPLRFFAQTLKATPGDRYTEFAVAVRKDDLFDYGGRPVIYDNDRALGSYVDDESAPEGPFVYTGGLPREVQFRWVGYDPTVLWDRDYPVDWTHEREWRTRPNEKRNERTGMGDAAATAVPILLPTLRPSKSSTPRFVVLVDTAERKRDLAAWILSHCGRIASQSEYGGKYSSHLASAPILSFEEIEDHTTDGLGRLEDFFPISA